MAKWWEYLFPIRSPLSFPEQKEKTIEHLPITTRKGRVVYNRRKHEFSRRDAARVLGGVFGAPGTQNDLPFWMAILENATIWMLDKILEFISQAKQPDEIASTIYYVLRNALARIIDRLPERQRKVALEFISDSGAK